MNQLRRKAFVILLSIMVSISFCPAGVFAAAADGDAAAKAVAEQKAEEQKKAEEAEKAAEKEAAEKAEAERKAAEEKAAAEKAEAEKQAAEEKAAAEKAAAEKAEAEKKAAEEKAAAEKAAAEQAEEKAPEESTAEEPEQESAEKQPAEEQAAEASEGAEQKEAGAKTLSTEDKAVAKAAANTSGYAKYTEIDNSTSLSDGTYKCSSFSFSGGTGKTKLSCGKIVVAGGKARAEIHVTSSKFTHLFTGEVDTDHNGDDVNKDLYDPSTGKLGKGVYKTDADGSGVKVSIPVSLGSEMKVAGRTTAMTEAHWIQYRITANATKADREGDAVIENGTYKPDSFTFSGGTGKTSFDCEKVIVKDGVYTAVFTTTSDKITHLYMGTPSGDAEIPSLYDPSTGKMGKGVSEVSGKKAVVTVSINEEKPFGARTTAMSEPHWIGYMYKISLSPSSEKISSSTEIPDSSEEEKPSEQTKPQKEDKPAPVEPTKKKKLGVGTWKINATTSRDMFYIYPKEKNPAKVILKVNKNGTMTATFSLSGEGYDYVYMGTPKQAKKAGKKNWIKAKIVNGYYTFTVPVSKLDKKLAITPHSQKYEEDGNPSTEPWRPDKWIIFYSNGAVKVKDGTTTVPTKKKKKSSSRSSAGKKSGTQTKFKNDHKADKVSKWKDDSSKSTGAVDNSTSLKDGVYTPDKFNWSGGSGRLAFIKCDKITVKGGQAFATIVFGSSHYDSLKANGRVYSKQGGGNSKFVIPVKLNANNTIIGRTTAMSQPHWVRYTIFVYKAGATSGSGAATGDDGHVTSTKKLSDKAPDLMGLKAEGKSKVQHAELFRIFNYEQGICLISIDQSKDTALYKKEKKGKAAEEKEESASPKVEYDEEGKPIAKTDSERTNDLYQNNVVNYLLVPKGVEIPAGLEKDCVIIEKPVKSSFIASQDVLAFAGELGAEKQISIVGFEDKEIKSKKILKAVQDEKIKATGTFDSPDYNTIVEESADLALLPSELLPEKITKDMSEKDKKKAEEQVKLVRKLQTRFSSLGIPVLIDRSDDEASAYAQAEWIQVYGAIFGQEKQAEKIYQDYIKNHEDKKLKH